MWYIISPYLFYNWKFVPFDSLHPFHIAPTPPLATTNLLSVSMNIPYSRSIFRFTSQPRLNKKDVHYSITEPQETLKLFKNITFNDHTLRPWCNSD